MPDFFMDGFDHYATADLTKKWSSVGSNFIISALGRRGGSSGGKGNSTSSSLAWATKTLGASASWVVGAAVYVWAHPIASGQIMTLLDAGTSQCDLRLNPDGTLSVTRNGTALAGGTSAVSLGVGGYYHIEWKCTIADSISADTCKVRVNGADVINVTAGQDLKNTANASANQARLGNVVNNGPVFEFDDVFFRQSGDFFGDCRIDTVYPNADGTYSQFTPSTGTTHYTLVDEAAPNTTDYNDGVNVGDRDSYGFQDLAALTSQTVYGVQVNAAINKDDAGAKSVATFARSGTTNVDGAAAVLGTSQAYVSQIYETDPNGGGAWTESSVNAAEFGVKVAA